MKRHRIPVVFLIALLLSFSACTKEVNVNLNPGVSQLCVSAFVNNKPGTQTIVLSNTESYFANTPCPPATGATVKVTDNKGNQYSFLDKNANGNYQWTPAPGDTLIRVNYTYTLSISYSGQNYQAVSMANPVPPIDSMNYQLQKGRGGFGKTDSYYAAFFATDIKGRSNYYWIKSYVNDSLINPTSLDLSVNGSTGFAVGEGLPFIYPVRESINMDGGFRLNDTLNVELHSINPNTYFFFQEVVTQTNNGGLFATPPANVSTNILNADPSSKSTAVGFFDTEMVSLSGIRIK